MAQVLVIGASRGIGRELAQQYIDNGDRVIATVRRAEDRDALLAQGAAAVHLIDVAQPQSVSGLAWLLDGEKFDYAWYVAGVLDHLHTTTPPTQQEFDRVMHTNLLGAMQALPQVAPMVQAAGGKFAFISSSMAQIGHVDDDHSWLYRCSKAALNMAVATAQHGWPGVLLLTMDPGWVRTEMGGSVAPLSVEESVQGMRATLASAQAADAGKLLHHDGRRADSW
jgi:NAD(P)-dependent dehydrogenase (short-subunit alcohol dehydrogenase family)